jgi:aminomethyltransferase
MQLIQLNQLHIDLGAKMVDFAGYSMPVQYSSIIEEHHAVRNSVGMFDVSHMGEFIIRGNEALKLVQKISSNDASRIKINQAQYSCMPNESGGIIDDMIIYRLPEENCNEGEQAFMLVVNASNIEKDWKWIESHNDFDTRMINISDNSSLLAVQGPNAIKTLQKLTKVNLNEIEYYHFRKGEIAGINNVIISATGYTGSGGFELYVDNQDVKKLWDAVMEAGAEFDIKPCGLGCRDTLRLEMGYCLYGNDIDDSTSPLEAGLGWITKLNVEDDFISKDLFVKQKEEGLIRKLVGFNMNSSRVPRKDYPIFDLKGNEIGKVTSGTQSPSLDIPIGMGYVNIECAKPGTEVQIGFRKKMIEAQIVKVPFVQINK